MANGIATASRDAVVEAMSQFLDLGAYAFDSHLAVHFLSRYWQQGRETSVRFLHPLTYFEYERVNLVCQQYKPILALAETSPEMLWGFRFLGYGGTCTVSRNCFTGKGTARTSNCEDLVHAADEACRNLRRNDCNFQFF